MPFIRKLHLPGGQDFTCTRRLLTLDRAQAATSLGAKRHAGDKKSPHPPFIEIFKLAVFRPVSYCTCSCTMTRWLLYSTSQIFRQRGGLHTTYLTMNPVGRLNKGARLFVICIEAISFPRGSIMLRAIEHRLSKSSGTLAPHPCCS